MRQNEPEHKNIMKPKRPLLSIVIPAFDRPKELLFCIEKFVSQIKGKFENDIEIIISDDHSRIDGRQLNLLGSLFKDLGPLHYKY